MKKRKIKVIIKVKAASKRAAYDAVTYAMNLAMLDDERIKVWGFPWEFKK